MKNRFLSNIFLTFIWVALTGDFTFSNFFFGFLLSFFILRMVISGASRAKYFRITPKVIAFIFYFFKELVKANVQVAFEVMTPKFRMTPGIVGFPLEASSDIEISIKDRETFIAGLKNGFEKRLLEILR
jgi:multicomponent Na+:H+ antiporter subunit E